MWPFKKQTLKQKRFARRKKYLQQIISRLTERKAILEIEIENINKDLVKQITELKNLIRKEDQDG